MRKLGLTLAVLFSCAVAFAQPANDFCGGAISFDPVPADGTPVCANGEDITSANDGTTGSFPCESNGGNPDMWYSFTATGTQFDYTITHGTMGYSEIHLMESSGGTCATLSTFGCATSGASPHTGTFTGMTVGTTYFVLISTTNANVGTFDLCIGNETPPPTPGQDCSNAQSLCNSSTISVGTVASGAGSVSGNSSEEDISTISCFGGDERQSQWYTFTAADNGTIEFAVDPVTYTPANCNGDDYDWALWDITSSGCALASNANNAIACNWSFCSGATGLSPTNLGLTGGTDYCNTNPTGPGTCVASPQWDLTVVNATAGNTYLILVDNFSVSNSGFDLIFGGTATLGPQGDFSVTDACGGDNNVSVSALFPNAVSGWTFAWDWGDGNSDNGTTQSHTYSTSGPYTVSLTVTDPLGCANTTSQSVSCTLPIELLDFTAKPAGDVVEIDWTTATEINNNFFTIERSVDGERFEMVTRIDGAGNSSSEIEYGIKDQDPIKGVSYYRLKQTDFDGTVSFSDVVSVRISEFEMSLYPNPTKGLVNLEINNNQREKLDIQVLNAAGQIVDVQHVSTIKGFNNYTLNVARLPKGVYTVKVIGSMEVHFSKLIKD